MITNINIGICQSRLQQGKPSFFVNWQEDGKQNYYFSSLRFAVENKATKLKTL